MINNKIVAPKNKLTKLQQDHGLLSSISKRSKLVSEKVRQQGTEIIDAFHGEMDFSMSAIAQQAIVKGTRDILEENAVLSEPNGYLFDKSQPTSLRQVVATHLYKYWSDAGLLFDIKNIVVSPYSSLMLLEAVLETVAKPNGIILCPEGFYKSNITHVEKYDLSLVSFPSNPQQDARVLAEVLRQAIQEHRQNLCAVLLTMPGNPFVVDYDLEELRDIGKVIIEEDVKVIIDAAFHGIQPDYIPFASVKLDIQEQSYSLFNHSVTINSISKSHHAIGPYKIATAMSGNADWLASIRKRLSIPFQRETTFFAKIIIQNTTKQYIQDNCQVMMERQDQAKERLQQLNQKYGKTVISYLGSSKYGPFMVITLDKAILDQIGIEDGWQLQDFFMAGAGIDSVAGPRMGISQTAIRININAPRIGQKKSYNYFNNMMQRIEKLLDEVIFDGITYSDVLEHIDIDNKISLNAYQENSIDTLKNIN